MTKKTWVFWAAFSMIFAFSTIAFTEEVRYTTHIKPVFDKQCIGCHGSDAAPEYYAFKEEKDKWLAKGKGMRMDTYSHLIFYTAWPDTGALMRRLDDGKNIKEGETGQHVSISRCYRRGEAEESQALQGMGW